MKMGSRENVRAARVRVDDFELGVRVPVSKWIK
jgi:hypothetical protein